IGPEVVDQAVRVLEEVAQAFGHQLTITQKPIGGAALLASKDPLPEDSLQACLSAAAVLLGAVGGPSFDSFPAHLRPESGLLRLRRELGVFANLRPAICFPALEDCSPLRPEVVRGTDVLIVRELLGGIYFGQPRTTEGPAGNRSALDTMRYSELEIERIAHVAFEVARSRRRKVTSVDKANVLHCSAPGIAGQGIASPLGAILSVAMLLRHSFKLEREAACIETAVAEALAAGNRTRDLAKPSQATLSTSQMGQKVVEAVAQCARAARSGVAI